MKKMLVLLVGLFPMFAAAQAITKYYDIDWMETTPEKATYISEFTKVETGYKCVSYWKSAKKKKEESFYADTSVTKPNGLQKVYYKNGKLEDSVFVSSDGKLTEAYHFYANGKLECHYLATADGTGKVLEAYDETGEKIKNYLYMRPVEPKGGVKKWQSYILKNANRELTSGNEQGKTAKVLVRFIVDEEGNAVRAKVLESSGLKSVDQDAVRLILESPQWVPAIYKNKTIRFPVNLPLTYELSPTGKK